MVLHDWCCCEGINQFTVAILLFVTYLKTGRCLIHVHRSRRKPRYLGLSWNILYVYQLVIKSMNYYGDVRVQNNEQFNYANDIV